MRPKVQTLDRLSPEEVRRLAGLGFFGGGSHVTRQKTPGRHTKFDPYSYEETGYASSYDADGYAWDMWATAYRMLGGFIDCDWQQGGDNMYDQEANYRSRNLNNNDDDGDANGDNACGRWMMWAAYANPNYQGGGYYEYFDDDGVRTGSLDCHEAGTEWRLIGVYRQEFYQFLEQIAKHLWAIDEYEYAVAWGGLDYMTDEDCFQLYPNDDDGTYVFAGVLPGAGGTFRMSLFDDAGCTIPTTDTKYEDVFVDEYYYNSYWSQFDDDEYVYNGNNKKSWWERRLDEDRNDVCNGDDDRRRLDDNGYMDCTAWASAREPSLEAVNSVFETYKYCTPCVDYPSYQDGYLIGDYGTDEDDLINQCWKFHSHDSYPCTGDCLLKAAVQGSITEVQVGGEIFGSWDGAGKVYRHGSRIKANMYVTLSAILFTSILFHSVRKRERRVVGAKSRTLLTADERQRARSPRKGYGITARLSVMRCRPVCCDTGRLLRPLLQKNRPKSPERYMIGDTSVPSSGAKAPARTNIRSRSPSPGHPQSAMFEDRGVNRAQPPTSSSWPPLQDPHSKRSNSPGPVSARMPSPMQERPRQPPEARPLSSQSQFDRKRSPMRHQRAHPVRSRSQSPHVHVGEAEDIYRQRDQPYRSLTHTRNPQMSLQHALDQPSHHAPRHRSRSSSPDRRRLDGHGSIRVLSQTPPPERHGSTSRPNRSSDMSPVFSEATGGGKSTPKTKKEWKEEFQRQKALSVSNKPSRRNSFRGAGERLRRKNKR